MAENAVVNVDLKADASEFTATIEEARKKLVELIAVAERAEKLGIKFEAEIVHS